MTRDPRSLHKRITALISKQLKALATTQRQLGQLELDDVKQVTMLAAALDGQIKTARLLDADEERAAKDLSDAELEALAEQEETLATLTESVNASGLDLTTPLNSSLGGSSGPKKKRGRPRKNPLPDLDP